MEMLTENWERGYELWDIDKANEEERNHLTTLRDSIPKNSPEKLVNVAFFEEQLDKNQEATMGNLAALQETTKITGFLMALISLIEGRATDEDKTLLNTLKTTEQDTPEFPKITQTLEEINAVKQASFDDAMEFLNDACGLDLIGEMADTRLCYEKAELIQSVKKHTAGYQIFDWYVDLERAQDPQFEDTLAELEKRTRQKSELRPLTKKLVETIDVNWDAFAASREL